MPLRIAGRQKTRRSLRKVRRSNPARGEAKFFLRFGAAAGARARARGIRVGAGEKTSVVSVVRRSAESLLSRGKATSRGGRTRAERIRHHGSSITILGSTQNLPLRIAGRQKRGDHSERFDVRIPLGGKQSFFCVLGPRQARGRERAAFALVPGRKRRSFLSSDGLLRVSSARFCAPDRLLLFVALALARGKLGAAILNEFIGPQSPAHVRSPHSKDAHPACL